MTQTLNFFSDLKVNPIRIEKLNESNFKQFTRQLIFDDALFESLEVKFKTIKDNMII
jgi:hypothetical protein